MVDNTVTVSWRPARGDDATCNVNVVLVLYVGLDLKVDAETVAVHETAEGNELAEVLVQERLLDQVWCQVTGKSVRVWWLSVEGRDRWNLSRDISGLTQSP